MYLQDFSFFPQYFTKLPHSSLKAKYFWVIKGPSRYMVNRNSKAAFALHVAFNVMAKYHYHTSGTHNAETCFKDRTDILGEKKWVTDLARCRPAGLSEEDNNSLTKFLWPKWQHCWLSSCKIEMAGFQWYGGMLKTTQKSPIFLLIWNQKDFFNCWLQRKNSEKQFFSIETEIRECSFTYLVDSKKFIF